MFILKSVSILLGKIPQTIKSKISYKLFLIYVIVISIPVLAFGISLYKLASATMNSDFIKYKENLNKQIIKSIDNDIKSLQNQSASLFLELDDILFFLDTTPDKISNKYFDTYNKLDRYFHILLQNNDRVDGITLTDDQGEVKYAIDRAGTRTSLASIKDEPWFKDTLALHGSPLLVEPHVNNSFIYSSQQGKNIVISIARTLNDQYSKQTKGVLLFDQNVNNLQELFTNIDLLDGEIIAILGKNDIIFCNSKLAADFQDTLISKINSSNGNESFIMNYNMKKLIVCYNKSSDFGWKVVSVFPFSDLQKRSNFLENIISMLIVIIIIFIFAISTFVSTLITIPLKKLASSFSILEKGNFDTTVHVNGTDELAQISTGFNKMVSNMKMLIVQKYELSLLKKQAEFESLQSQINPHFLYNTLNSIKTVAEKKDHSTVSLMVQTMSDIFRYSLNKGVYIVKFSEELEHVKKYLYLQECRFKGKYNIFYDIDVEVANNPILRLTLQPLVENAIYHGMEPNAGKGELRITAKAIGNKYYIYISDNGVGIPPQELAHINSLLESGNEISSNSNPNKLGIYNVNARIKFHFGNEYGLRINSTPGLNTTVKITLPIGS